MTMDKHRSILLIANPASNKGRGGLSARAAESHLKKLGLDVTMEFTTGPGDAERIATEAIAQSPETSCIAVCGGDGSIQQVANVLANETAKGNKRTPSLGLIRCGRCNDFARAFNIPKDPVAAADVLARGETRKVDLGTVNGRYFCTVATAGIDAEVSRFVDQMRVPLKGTIAYLFGAVCVLLRYRAPKVTITGDFGSVTDHFFMATSANTSSYGGAIPIAPDASPYDGLLDVCMVKRINILRAMTLMPAFLKGKHTDKKEVQIHKTTSLTLETDSPMELWADGERIAETPAELKIVPNAIRVVVPSAE